MAQNITTLNEIRDNNPSGASITLSDLLYMVNGAGSTRDRAYTVEELKDFLIENLDKVQIGDNWQILESSYGAFVLQVLAGNEWLNVATISYGSSGVGGYIQINNKNLYIAQSYYLTTEKIQGIADSFRNPQNLTLVGDVYIDKGDNTNTSGDLKADGKIVSLGREINSYGDSIPSGSSYFKLDTDGLFISNGPGSCGTPTFNIEVNGSTFDVSGVGDLTAKTIETSGDVNFKGEVKLANEHIKIFHLSSQTGGKNFAYIGSSEDEALTIEASELEINATIYGAIAKFTSVSSEFIATKINKESSISPEEMNIILQEGEFCFVKICAASDNNYTKTIKEKTSDSSISLLRSSTDLVYQIIRIDNKIYKIQ